MGWVDSTPGGRDAAVRAGGGGTTDNGPVPFHHCPVSSSLAFVGFVTGSQ